MRGRGGMLAATALVLALVARAPGRALAFTWEACDAGAAPWAASDVGLDPDPPVIGGPVTFTIKTQAGATQQALRAGAAAGYCRRGEH